MSDLPLAVRNLVFRKMAKTTCFARIVAMRVPLNRKATKRARMPRRKPRERS